MGPGRPKNKSAQNVFKMDMCVGLIDTNPTQLERAQTDILCERYRSLCSFRQTGKKMLTVQSVQC
jgi:hypothetical protein